MSHSTLQTALQTQEELHQKCSTTVRPTCSSLHPPRALERSWKLHLQTDSHGQVQSSVCSVLQRIAFVTHFNLQIFFVSTTGDNLGDGNKGAPHWDRKQRPIYSNGGAWTKIPLYLWNYLESQLCFLLLYSFISAPSIRQTLTTPLSPHKSPYGRGWFTPKFIPPQLWYGNSTQQLLHYPLSAQ